MHRGEQTLPWSVSSDTECCSVWFKRKCLSQLIQTHHIVQTSTPIFLTQRQPHCSPRAANETNPLTEVSCANRRKGFPPVEIKNKQGCNVREITSYDGKPYCTFMCVSCLFCRDHSVKSCEMWDIVITSSPFPKSHSCPPCPSPRPPRWQFPPHSAPLGPAPAPGSPPSEGNGSSW